MREKFAVILTCLTLVLGLTGFSGPVAPEAPPLLGPESSLTSLGPDEYGYELKDSFDPEVTYSFEDISGTGGGNALYFSDLDRDDGTALVNIVSFPYYSDVATSNAYVSVNGFLSFNSISRKTDIPKPFPTDSKPNNMVAAFWYDLSLDTGSTIYTKNVLDTDPRTIIQWDNVKVGALGYVTFEIILRPSGDIVFSYEPNATSFTGVFAGIEDVDGVTGLNYAIPDLSSGVTVAITRPIVDVGHPYADIHVKARPQLSSAFFTNGEAWLSVDVTNTTYDTGPLNDSYDLAWEILESDPAIGDYPWNLTFYNPGCTSVITEVVNLSRGITTQLCMRITAGGEQYPGYYARFKVTLTSQAVPTDPRPSTTIYLQTAVDAPFSQLYQDSDDGLLLDLNRPLEHTTLDIAVPYGGSYMAMNMVRPGHYIITWLEGSDIHYRLYDQYPGTLHETKQIPASADDPNAPDLSPSVAGSRNGYIGLAYLVNNYVTVDDVVYLNSNVYYTLLDSDGNIVDGYPTNMTNNTGWLDYTYGYPDAGSPIPEFLTPRIVQAGDNKFGLVWRAHYKPFGMMEMDQIQYWVVDTDYADPLYGYVAELSTSYRHISPATTPLDDGRFMIGFINYTGASFPWVINYTVINPDASTSIPATPIIGSSTDQMDVVQLLSGKVLFGWKGLTTSVINYAILGNDLTSVDVSPTSIAYEDYPGHLNYRAAGYPSVTRSVDGMGVITWQDQDWQEQLYYALIGTDGSLMTPPSLYRRVGSTLPEAQISTNSYGNAPLASETIKMTVLLRNFVSKIKYFFTVVNKEATSP
jgi:hypothetical protein